MQNSGGAASCRWAAGRGGGGGTRGPPCSIASSPIPSSIPASIRPPPPRPSLRPPTHPPCPSLRPSTHPPSTSPRPHPQHPCASAPITPPSMLAAIRLPIIHPSTHLPIPHPASTPSSVTCSCVSSSSHPSFLPPSHLPFILDPNPHPLLIYPEGKPPPLGRRPLPNLGLRVGPPLLRRQCPPGSRHLGCTLWPSGDGPDTGAAPTRCCALDPPPMSLPSRYEGPGVPPCGRPARLGCCLGFWLQRPGFVLAERGAAGRGSGHQPADGVLLVRALLRHLLQVLGAGHRPRPAHRRAGPGPAQ